VVNLLTFKDNEEDENNDLADLTSFSIMATIVIYSLISKFLFLIQKIDVISHILIIWQKNFFWHWGTTEYKARSYNLNIQLLLILFTKLSSFYFILLTEYCLRYYNSVSNTWSIRKCHTTVSATAYRKCSSCDKDWRITQPWAWKLEKCKILMEQLSSDRTMSFSSSQTAKTGFFFVSKLL
jgi:hypothetical protein